MKKLLYWIDGKFNLIIILFLFWALFWGLNGGDKFFNGFFQPNMEAWSSKGVLLDNDGNAVYSLHPTETVGFYGVNRDSKMINYFKIIGLPRKVALFSLYGIAVLEVILGFVFLALFVWELLPHSSQKSWAMFADRTVHRLAFKGSLVIFVIFSTGDILFGDRMELWEHGTFIVMTLLT